MASLNHNVRKIALVMGVANSRSIAWACVESFLEKDYDCIVTYRNDGGDGAKLGQKINKLVEKLNQSTKHEIVDEETHSNDDRSSLETPRTLNSSGSRVLGCLPCSVDRDIPSLFIEKIPSLLRTDTTGFVNRRVDAIVHSIAYADMKGPSDDNTDVDESLERDKRLFLSDATWKSYQESQRISAYSFLETAHYALESDILSSLPSLTALTYIGSIRAVPNYHLMGPAKASLESIVRGLALDLGKICGSDDMSRFSRSIRVNAVSAGPLKTAAARGIPGFTNLYHHAAKHSPLKRNVTTKEVAEAVTWIASPRASGITGQTLYVDGGYSSVIACDA